MGPPHPPSSLGNSYLYILRVPQKGQGPSSLRAFVQTLPSVMLLPSLSASAISLNSRPRSNLFRESFLCLLARHEPHSILPAPREHLLRPPLTAVLPTGPALCPPLTAVLPRACPMAPVEGAQRTCVGQMCQEENRE